MTAPYIIQRHRLLAGQTAEEWFEQAEREAAEDKCTHWRRSWREKDGRTEVLFEAWRGDPGDMGEPRFKDIQGSAPS